MTTITNRSILFKSGYYLEFDSDYMRCDINQDYSKELKHVSNQDELDTFIERWKYVCNSITLAPIDYEIYSKHVRNVSLKYYTDNFNFPINYSNKTKKEQDEYDRLQERLKRMDKNLIGERADELKHLSIDELKAITNLVSPSNLTHMYIASKGTWVYDSNKVFENRCPEYVSFNDVIRKMIQHNCIYFDNDYMKIDKNWSKKEVNNQN